VITDQIQSNRSASDEMERNLETISLLEEEDEQVEVLPLSSSFYNGNKYMFNFMLHTFKIPVLNNSIT
jgi:hypothetical protein